MLASVRLAWVLMATLLVSGCFGARDGPGSLVPYPRLGDIAVYEASGALVEFARWENGIPFAAALAQVRIGVSSSGDAIDGARAQHPAFHVRTEVAEAGVFAQRSERWVSPRHEAVIQSYYKLSQDQSVVAFDERGFPWLFGASALFGEDLTPGAEFVFTVPDNLGRHGDITMTWRVIGDEGGLTRLDLDANGMNGSLWMEPGVAWPSRVHLSITSEALAPHMKSDSGYPVTMNARRISLTTDGPPVAARDRGATFGPDPSIERAPWDGEKPPDGDATALEYPLSEAVQQAKLLDKPLTDWLAAHDEPILYRGTYQVTPGPIDGSTSPLWLLQWVDRANEYYEVQISRTLAPPLPIGVPRIEKSAPAEAPADTNHGWFARDTLPETLVPLSEGIRVVRDLFGAKQVQIFLRSFADPPGYSYFIDGGFETEGRYTVVYNPNTGFVEQSTGPIQPRLA